MEKRNIIQEQKEEEYRLTHNVELKIRKERKKIKNIIHGVMKKKNSKNQKMK